ncbi:MAG: ATP-dependent zinc protease [Thermodesulfobacteriota bacterium]
MGMIFVLAFGLLFLIAPETVRSEKKISIGLVEDILLLPWGVKLPARIDTGAATSSLDARGLKVQDKIAEFRLPDEYGGLKLRLPIVDWRYVRSAEIRERRPVVEMEICIGPKRIRTRVNLNDRSMVKHPFIVGRNVLRGNFVVDCMKSNCLPPSCPEVFSK